MDTRHILIIDDNHDLRVCLRGVLENAGFTVASAANGKDALDVLKKGPTPKLIIVDLDMPIMSGEEFLNQKKMEHPDVPAIVITGHKIRNNELKVDGILAKPLDWDAVVNQAMSYCKVWFKDQQLPLN